MSSRVRPWLPFAGSLLLLALMACGIMRSILPSAGPPPRPFNHQAHLERGPDCATCHEGATTQDRAGMPSRESCMMCHDEIDKDASKPVEKKVAWFLDASGRPEWSAFTRQNPDVKFSHRVHAGKKIACAACHAGIERDTGLVPSGPQRMASCVSCHEKQAPAKTDCRSCHVSIDRGTPPPNHSRLWDKLHGSCSRTGRATATANDCAMCHQQDSCTTCHQTRPPADHTAFWGQRAHGIAAGIDRSRCATCHASDSCSRCHQETAPVSHRAGWNAPRSGHCASCHVPVQSSGSSCFVCHKSTPGHASAPPKPAWHNAAMNCRSCHAGSLRHLDNGDSCNACHR
jgi:hypothetical protein